MLFKAGGGGGGGGNRGGGSGVKPPWEALREGKHLAKVKVTHGKVTPYHL